MPIVSEYGKPPQQTTVIRNFTVKRWAFLSTLLQGNGNVPSYSLAFYVYAEYLCALKRG